MITPKDILPEKSLYAIGATVISIINKAKTSEIDPEKIYQEFLSSHPIDISYNYFLYSLDWLFLIGFIELNSNKRKIKKCF